MKFFKVLPPCNPSKGLEIAFSQALQYSLILCDVLPLLPKLTETLHTSSLPHPPSQARVHLLKFGISAFLPNVVGEENLHSKERRILHF